ncbi:response regulator transcription factor [Agarivorans gilvus]|nr:response regulator transcription factor [Agarivorans gilvus]
MRESVLIVEDDADIAELLRVNLAELGIDTVAAVDGAEGYRLALECDFNLLILDVTLPGMNGLDICREVRERKPHLAIMIITSKNSELDRVLGLELGADDYITKPFSVRELRARVRAQLRKAQIVRKLHSDADSPEEPKLVIGSLRINQKYHQVLLNEQAVDLTATEFDLLFYLASHPNQVFSRNQLLDSVWGYHHSGYEHTVNSHINRLRAKIERDATSPQIVQTVWGVGYKFSPKGVDLLV